MGRTRRTSSVGTGPARSGGRKAAGRTAGPAAKAGVRSVDRRNRRGAGTTGPSRQTSRRRSGSNTILDTMEQDYALGPRWSGSRNAWVKRLLPAQKGRIGEELFAQIAQAAKVAITARTGSGHDRRADGVPVEVKMSTLYDTPLDGDEYVQWLQVRPNGDFTDVALLAVCPDHVHLWMVTRAVALREATGQHGGKSATETLSLVVDPHHPPRWLGPDLADDGEGLAAAMSAARARRDRQARGGRRKVADAAA